MRGVAFELPNRDGLPLRGDVLLPDGEAAGRPTVVVCHGFKGFKNWGFFPELGRRLAQGGFLTILFNFSGSGIGPDLENFTELDRFAGDTMSRQLDDLGCVLDALEAGRLPEAAPDLERVALLGHSRGGAAALLRARDDRRIGAVVTWAAVSTLWRYSERELGAWKRQGFLEFLNTRTQQQMRIDYTAVEDLEENRERYDVVRAVAELQIPLLLVHGEQDLSVPVQEGRELLAARTPGSATLHEVQGAGHTFGAVHPWAGTTPALEEAMRVSLEWLQAHLRLAPRREGHA
ncbi:MAG: alpha/beta fold hydrolase [Candidatus Latescibacterota bacterium]|nr:MAG: alpha/beta fold hydrolase [Candidatus Latescibacterota bacterium]